MRIDREHEEAILKTTRRVPLARNLDLAIEMQVQELQRLMRVPLLRHGTPHSRLLCPQLRLDFVGQRHFRTGSFNSPAPLSFYTFEQPLQRTSSRISSTSRSSLQKSYSNKMSFSNTDTGSKDADPYAKTQLSPFRRD